MESIFYVYEHWRPDVDVCFYVGKGHGRRAWMIQGRHNAEHRSVVGMLAASGLCVEVRLVAGGLGEAEAYAAETERIQFWREAGIVLANKNDGGRGGRNPLPFTRAKIGKANTGKKRSPELKAHFSIIRRRENLSAATLAQMSATKTGKKFTAEHAAKIGQANVGRQYSTDTLQKMRLAKLGKPQSAELVERRTAPLRGPNWTPEKAARRKAQRLIRRAVREPVD